MFKNITIGQYYPVESYLHSLDARVKLLGIFVYITALFIVDNIWGYLFAVACLVLMIYMSNVPPLYIARGLKGILMIILFTTVLNIFFTPGEDILFSVFGLNITTRGVITAVKMTVRLALLIMGSSLLTLTTSSMQLTDAIEFILKPFSKIGVPSHEIAMMMTIALRFIPTLLEEMDKIMKAQMARGADFDTGGLMKKAKSLVPLLVPLFISAIRRAYDLATAMEARCYRGDINRTRMKEMVFKMRDYRAIGMITVFFAAVIGLNML